jgi:hypothetical protein
VLASRRRDDIVRIENVQYIACPGGRYSKLAELQSATGAAPGMEAAELWRAPKLYCKLFQTSAVFLQGFPKLAVL